MPNIVGVRFKRAGRVFYFGPADLALEVGDNVVVETPKGLDVGWVVIAPKQVLESELTEAVKPVQRKATPEDLRQRAEYHAKEKEAVEKARELIARLNLSMKVLSAEYNLDGTRLTLYFTAEERVDFREILKELAATLKTRVELRQVGARDAAKLLGGMGHCGLSLCCHTHLCSFETISIKMAKEQDLPLNPVKISGLCGRLLCCLSYEYEQYRQLKEKLPRPGQAVNTPQGPATVIGSNLLKETVLVKLEGEATAEFPLEQIVPI